MLAGRDKARGLGQVQRGGLQCLGDGGVPGRAQRGRDHADALRGGLGFDRVLGKALVHIGQKVLQRALHARVRCLGAVAQAHYPASRVVQVVARFLDRLGGDRGQLVVAAGQ
ncbi:hypothetical protein D3C80_1851790 [compost metagenome]